MEANLSDDSSSDGYQTPAKCPRVDTYDGSSSSTESTVHAAHPRSRALSSTSHGSVLQESEDDSPEQRNDNYVKEHQTKSNVRLRYTQQSRDEDIRLSRSSLSDNCSSPIGHQDEYHQTQSFDSVDNEFGKSHIISGFQDDDDKPYFSKTSSNQEVEGLSGDYSEKAMKMMGKMGYKSGKGLGKFEHGRVEPVSASTQKGRRGLGLKPSIVGEVPRDFKWTPDEAKPEAKELVSWMPAPPTEEPLSGDILEQWIQLGPKKLTIDDETEFVDPQILKGILESKTIFDTLDDEDLRRARFRSNPYETIGAVIFLNRAAVKMANIDAVFNFMFTKPKKPDGTSALDKKEILYFADVCAGPGGFSEYILYRRGWKSKGFGFTLKGSNDFKLSDFYAGTPETFNPYYGTENDGNIFNPANLTALKDNVLKHTEDKGVHFLMADGGFSVEGQENIQEILSKQLYLCQCLAALMLVRTGGHFVVKLFDVFTMFSVGLIYIMYRCFDQVCIHKPVTSRPANSERYLVCLYKKLGTEPAEHHLFSVNSTLWKNRDGNHDVLELVPLNVLQEDGDFFEYIYKSNIELGEKQIKNLLKIAAFSKHKNLKEDNQAEMRKQCLKLWQLPDSMRIQPEKLPPEDMLASIITCMKNKPPESHSLGTFKQNVLNQPPEYLDKPSVFEMFKSVFDWHFVFLSSAKNSSDLRFFLGCGGKHVYQLEGNKWKNIVDLHINLPAKTLLYGEIVREYEGQGNTQLHTKALHVIDALVLGGVDISYLTFTERSNQCVMFCNALYKPFDYQALPMRCKKLFNMEAFSAALDHLEFRAMKRVKKAVTITIQNRIDRVEKFYTVGSIMFFKEIREPWVAQMSKRSGCKYYFRIGADKKPQSEYHIVDEARLDMLGAYCCRVMWPWEPFANAIFEGHHVDDVVARQEVENYIHHNINKK